MGNAKNTGSAMAPAEDDLSSRAGFLADEIEPVGVSPAPASAPVVSIVPAGQILAVVVDGVEVTRSTNIRKAEAYVRHHYGESAVPVPPPAA